MTQLYIADFSANGTANATPTTDVSGESMGFMVTGTFGSGTLNVQLWSEARNTFRTVASFTAATTSAKEIYIGVGQRIQFELTGASGPSIEIDYWFV